MKADCHVYKKETMTNKLKVIILAAGQGRRLGSEQADCPKVLRLLKEKALLDYVLDSLSFINSDDRYLVVGFQKEKVIAHYQGQAQFCVQDRQLGTGHAVMSCQHLLENEDCPVMVVYGDMPLFRQETFLEMIDSHRNSQAVCTVMTGIFEKIPDYGRIIRNENGKIVRVIEVRDCSSEQLKISEVNVGVLICNSKLLFESLSELRNDNAQMEYYLTDLTEILIQKGFKVNTYLLKNTEEALGINTLEDLIRAENFLK